MSANAAAARLTRDQQRSLLDGLLDDASLFPPASLPMRNAAKAHSGHESAWFSDLTGPFVCPETRIAELGAAMTSANIAWIDLSLVVTAGAAAIPAATDTVAADPRFRLRAIEVPAARDADPAQAVSDVAAALDAVPLAAATGYIEIPLDAIAGTGNATGLRSNDHAATSLPSPIQPSASQSSELLAIADRHGYRPKLRTGGVTSEAFPDEPTLAACLSAVVDQRIPFKCTAGLHHAVRHTASDTGFEHHGFLNVLLAVGAAHSGGNVADVAAVLAERDPAKIAAAVCAIDPETAAEIRWLFTSFGTCSTDEPVADLISLGLLSQH